MERSATLVSTQSAMGKAPMTHGLASLLAVLALLTGLVLGSLGKIGLQPYGAIPAFESRNQQIGRQYYKALDTLMLTGDDNDMRLLLGEDFQDHQSTTEGAVAAEQLTAEYQSLRNVNPGSRYVVDELVAAGDLVIATLAFHPAGPPEFAGIEIALNHPRSVQEILRIRDGFVVERWSDSGSSPRLMTIAALGEIAFIGVPELQRWQFEPYSFDTIRARSDVILIVEQGEFIAEMDTLSIPPAEHRRSIPATQPDIAPELRFEKQLFARGDVVHIPDGSVLRFWNTASQTASILTIGGHSSGRNGQQFDDGAKGVHRQLLARGFSLGSVIPAFSVFIGQVELSPGDEFVHSGIPDGGEIVIVTAGSLTATSPGGLIWTADDDAVITSNEQQHLPARKGAAIAHGSEVRFVADLTRQTSFFVVTFVPVEPSS